MYELNKRAVHPPHRLLWSLWERVSAVAWGWGEGGGFVSQERYYGGGVPGYILAALVELSRGF